ncbi:MAG: NlpC/P60 family protein [Anaerovoracaceae bacterium]|jgi:hypothetical protein
MSKSACIAQKAPGYVGKVYKLGEEFAYVVGYEQTTRDDGDCSGLVYALFRDCNVLLKGRSFPRETADDYWRRATKLSGPERIGDCCWFPRTGRKTHIALYVGGGKTIEAGYHGANNRYPGHGYVGTCTVAQMNARGAVWGRIERLDIYEEDDMTPEEVRQIVREELEVVWSDTVERDQKYLVEKGIIQALRPKGKIASVSYVDSLLARVLRKALGE